MMSLGYLMASQHIPTYLYPAIWACDKRAGDFMAN